MSSPTQRALAECKRRGWVAQVVEKWNPHARVRQDLFGVIDIVAIRPAGHYEDEDGPLYTATGNIIGIQATSGTNHSARVAKSKAEPRLRAWLNAGARFVVWSYAKRGARGKRKTWQLREEAVTL